MIAFYTHRFKDKCIRTYTDWNCPLGQHIHMTSSNLRSAVSCKFWCLCPLDARWRYMSLEFSMWSLEWCQKKWRVIFPKAPHRVQSHYRPCQIQLVTEFAAQERGEEKQDGERWGVGMKWISWWENSWLPVLIIEKINKERTSLRWNCWRWSVLSANMNYDKVRIFLRIHSSEIVSFWMRD